jgi:methylase of polypeptide subunit release factors
MWPEVLNRLREIKRTPWSLISQESAAVDMVDGVLTLAFKQPTLRDTFLRREDFQANLRQAISDVRGLDVRFEAIVSNPPYVPDGATVSGSPAMDHRDWLRASAAYGRLGDLVKEVQRLRRRVEALEAARKPEGT